MTPTSTPAQATPAPAQPTPALPTIPGVKITSSKQILSKDSRLAWLVWAPSGYGKTALAGQLDELTIKTMGKRTLYIACEAAEGGGAATIRDLDAPLYVPKSYEECDKVLRQIRNQKDIGGVVVDSATEFFKQHIKATTLKYPCRENVATRQIGVLTRSDYQVAGDITSQFFRNLLALTTIEDPAYKKHVIITAADQTKEEDDRVVWVGPDLPGRMSREAVQMFQQVATILLEAKTIDGKRELVRSLSFVQDGVKALKDRLNLFPGKMQLRKTGATDSEGETLLSIWERYFVPQMAA